MPYSNRNCSLMASRFGSLALAAAAAILTFGCSSGGSAPAGPRVGTEPGKFVWHDLTTGDVDSAKTFYTALLGWDYVDTTVLGRPYTVARLGKNPVLVALATAAVGCEGVTYVGVSSGYPGWGGPCCWGGPGWGGGGVYMGGPV